jgi:toxin ParE1/3/4
VIPYILHRDAEAELGEALDYYEQKRPGLARAFRLEFEAALERVRQNPLGYAEEDESGIRFCPLRRFPYTLVYLNLENHVWVAAVAHQHRRPGYWARRQPE